MNKKQLEEICRQKTINNVIRTIENTEQLFGNKVFVQSSYDVSLTTGKKRFAGMLNVILSDGYNMYREMITDKGRLSDDDAVKLTLEFVDSVIATGESKMMMAPTNHLVEGAPRWSEMFQTDYEMMDLDELKDHLRSLGDSLKQCRILSESM